MRSIDCPNLKLKMAWFTVPKAFWMWILLGCRPRPTRKPDPGFQLAELFWLTRKGRQILHDITDYYSSLFWLHLPRCRRFGPRPGPFTWPLRMPSTSSVAPSFASSRQLGPLGMAWFGVPTISNPWSSCEVEKHRYSWGV